MTQGFYRVLDDGALLHAPSRVVSPSGTYTAAGADGYAYPIDGVWRWFESEAAALAHYAAPDPEAVPTSVSPYHARSALLAAGLLPSVEAAVTAAGGQVAIAWEYGLEVRRDSPMIAALSGALGLTSEQVDGLFRSAAAIQ